MKSPMLGLRTVINIVPNLDEAITWYTKAFGIAPYFNEPFYVGFNIGGFELGLMPEEGEPKPKGENVIAYWGIKSEATLLTEYTRLLKLGATILEEPHNVGGPLVVAAVKDPWGNPIGLIYNPVFRIE